MNAEHLEVAFPSAVEAVSLQAAALPEHVKWSYVTRNVAAADAFDVRPLSNHQPTPGDLVLVRIERIAQHTKVQLRSGRRSQLFVGDHVILAFGNRYAPDQFEAEIPASLGRCHMVAAGGLAATAVSKHNRLKWPTAVRSEGFLVDRHGTVLNLAAYKTTRLDPAPQKPVIAIAGTSMNAGKTTTVAALTKGLTRAGYRVAALKVTGTGAGNDLWAYEDAGAVVTMDFTDAGHASTYRLAPQAIETCFAELVSTARRQADVDVVLVEVADGLLHRESLDLLTSDLCRRTCHKLVFAAGEALGAKAGVDTLEAAGLPVWGVSGLVTASELARREASAATGIRVLTREALESADIREIFA